jgi:hypothetical protein
MGQELTTFADRPALSTKFATFFQENKNIQDKETTPSLSIEGKNFTVILNGEKTVIQKRDADGELEPVKSLKVIILDAAQTRGRSYYAGAYDPSKATMPDCWSDDSVTPSKNVKKPCAASCAACPMSAKGSRPSTRNKEGVACGQHQMIAVIPASDFTFEPLRVKLPITSVWDGKNPANDEACKFAFKNYTDYLRAHQVDHTALLVTKLTFDKDAEYPKLLFQRDVFLNDEQIEKLIPIIQSDKVKQLISSTWTPNGRDGVRVAELSGPEDNAAAAAAKDVTPPKTTEAEAAAKVAQEVAAKLAADAAAKAEAKAKKVAEAKAAAEAAAAAAAAAAKAAEDDDDGEPVLPGSAAAAPTQPVADAKAGAPKVKATPAAAPATTKPATADAATGAPPGLDKLLGAWGE